MSAGMLPPASRPCDSCPYRRDVPSGIWAADEYAKLLAYDEPTALQPGGLFQCHQYDPSSDVARVCAGWAGCHGSELLALRLASVDGRMTAADAQTAARYRSPVPLFATGAQAAAHGTRDLLHPSVRAVDAAKKIVHRRADLDGVITRADSTHGR